MIELNKDEAYKNKSNTKQIFFNKNANERTAILLRDHWLPIIEFDFSKQLSEPFHLYVDENDLQTICFAYPRSFEDDSILQIIRLEIGALAETIPSVNGYINPYIADVYPMLFDTQPIKVLGVDISRTFYEKITILHREANRINGNYPERYSRHFYDLYQMIKKGIGAESLNKIEILRMVVHFKKKFYSCNWANYDDVLSGNCLLIPNEKALDIFSEDYDKMKHMLYNQIPSFPEIIHTLSEFEKLLNDKIKQTTE